MKILHVLRQSRSIPLGMLLSFVMALTVAALAPWVQHTSPAWVCTVSGPVQRMASAAPAPLLSLASDPAAAPSRDLAPTLGTQLARYFGMDSAAARTVDANATGNTPAHAPPHLLDCVLCLALNMPPAWAGPAVAQPQAFAPPQPWGRTAARPRLQTSQLGARGPPASV